MASKKSKKLGLKIKKLRKETDLTQDQFARKAKIPYTSFTKIEQGEIKSPSIYVVAKIAKTLNIAIADLIA